MYGAAVQSRGDYFPAKFNLGWTYLKVGDYSRAFDIFKSLAAGGTRLNYVTRAKVLNNMGYALWKMGDRKKAAGLFSESFKTNPKFKIAEKNLHLAEGILNQKAV